MSILNTWLKTAVHDVVCIFSLEMNLQKQLVKIHNDVRKFQRELIDVKPTPKCKCCI